MATERLARGCLTTSSQGGRWGDCREELNEKLGDLRPCLRPWKGLIRREGKTGGKGFKRDESMSQRTKSSFGPAQEFESGNHSILVDIRENRDHSRRKVEREREGGAIS